MRGFHVFSIVFMLQTFPDQFVIYLLYITTSICIGWPNKARHCLDCLQAFIISTTSRLGLGPGNLSLLPERSASRGARVSQPKQAEHGQEVEDPR